MACRWALGLAPARHFWAGFPVRDWNLNDYGTLTTSARYVKVAAVALCPATVLCAYTATEPRQPD